MPRNGSGVYSKPPNSTAMPDTEIRSAMFNAVIDDLVADANNPRPMSAGGTGAQNPAGARAAFEVDKKVMFSVKGANYTLVKEDNNGTIAVSANATMALSTVATLGASWHAIIIADGGIATIDPSGSEKINGADTLVLQNGQSALVVATGISGDEFTAIVFAGDVFSKADLEAKIAGASPIGSVIMMAGNGTNPPPGFLLMNGASVTSAYPALRAWLLANGANVDGSGNPIIEDMGGYFPRGWRSGQVVDSGRVFGSVQQDALQNITGTTSLPPTLSTKATGAFALAGADGTGDVARGSNNGNALSFDASRVARTSTETRPSNKTFTYWIRAYAGDQAPGAADLAALTNNVQTLQNAVNRSGRKKGQSVAPSGTSVLYSGLPSGISEVTLNFRNVTFTPNAAPIIRLGTSAGPVAAGYTGGLGAIASNVGYSSAPLDASGIVLLGGSNVNPTLDGEIRFTRVPGTNNWAFFGQFFMPAGSYHMSITVNGGVTLPGELDRIQLSTAAPSTATIGGTAIWADWETAQ